MTRGSLGVAEAAVSLPECAFSLEMRKQGQRGGQLPRTAGQPSGVTAVTRRPAEPHLSLCPCGPGWAPRPCPGCGSRAGLWNEAE